MIVVYKYVIKYLLALTHQIKYFDKIFFVGLKDDNAVKRENVLCIPRYVQVKCIKENVIKW